MNQTKKATADEATTHKRTLVEEGTTIKGSLSSSCPIDVQGSIAGEIESPAVNVSVSGAVSGKVTTNDLKSDGKIEGTFDVDSAKISGSVAKNTVLRANSLDLKLTASSGKLQLAFGPAAPVPRR